MLNLLRAFLPRRQAPRPIANPPAHRLALTRLEDRDVPAPLTLNFTLDGSFGLSPTNLSLFQANLNTAGQLWSSQLGTATGSAATLEVRVVPAATLPNNAYAQCGATTYPNVGGTSMSGTLYEALTGSDPNGTGSGVSTSDITMTVSTAYLQSIGAFASVNGAYFDTSGLARNTTVPSNKTDVVSVVLHELGHGLGVISNRDTNGSYPSGYLPTTLDTKLTGTAPNLMFSGPKAVAAYGSGVPMGSGPNAGQGYYSHVSVANNLMYYSIGSGVRRAIGTVDRGILYDLGYQPASVATAGQKIYATSNSGVVQVYSSSNALLYSYTPFPGWTGEVRVAVGDVNGDNVLDIAAAPGSGGGPRVQVSSGVNGANIYDFFAYPGSFTGGVFVALGDTNGDGRADIITGQGTGGSAVYVFNGNGLNVLAALSPYPGFTGGVTVAAGDTTGDGRAEVITGAGPGGGPAVTVYNGNGFSSLGAYFAFAPSFTGGIYVAAGDVNGDGRADIIAGAGAGGGPAVNVRSGNGFGDLGSFFAYDPSFTGGVRVAARDVNGDGRADIITGAGAGGGPNLRVFNGNGYGLMTSFFPFNPANTSGIFVG